MKGRTHYESCLVFRFKTNEEVYYVIDLEKDKWWEKITRMENNVSRW